MKVPFVALHGELDQLCNVQGSKDLYEKAPVKDKELKIYPKALHHLYREPVPLRNEAMQDTVDWIVKRIPA